MSKKIIRNQIHNLSNLLFLPISVIKKCNFPYILILFLWTNIDYEHVRRIFVSTVYSLFIIFKCETKNIVCGSPLVTGSANVGTGPEESRGGAAFWANRRGAYTPRDTHQVSPWKSVFGHGNPKWEGADPPPQVASGPRSSGWRAMMPTASPESTVPPSLPSTSLPKTSTLVHHPPWPAARPLRPGLAWYGSTGPPRPSRHSVHVCLLDEAFPWLHMTVSLLSPWTVRVLCTPGGRCSEVMLPMSDASLPNRFMILVRPGICWGTTTPGTIRYSTSALKVVTVIQCYVSTVSQ